MNLSVSDFVVGIEVWGGTNTDCLYDDSKQQSCLFALLSEDTADDDDGGVRVEDTTTLKL